MIGRKQAALAALLFSVPIAANAEQAPSNCTKHFVSGELPDVASNRAPETKLLCFSQYALLHSGLSKTPVWSAEHLTRARIQKAANLKRKNPFHTETRLPPDQRAELSDYKGSNFDRGHMSPNGDMSTVTGQHDSFSLANMIPQDPCSNEEQWEGIESAVRTLTLSKGEVFVVTGPIYPVGASLLQIGNGVLVPTQIFKAIYVPSLNQAAAYVAPNTPAKEWKAVSIADLQKLVDVDVYPGLSSDVKSTAMDLPPPEPPKFHCRVHEN